MKLISEKAYSSLRESNRLLRSRVKFLENELTELKLITALAGYEIRVRPAKVSPEKMVLRKVGSK